MTEEMRHEIVQRRQSGMSLRAIAEELGISRGAVYRALARVQAQRDGRAAPSARARKAVSGDLWLRSRTALARQLRRAGSRGHRQQRLQDLPIAGVQLTLVRRP